MEDDHRSTVTKILVFCHKTYPSALYESSKKAAHLSDPVRNGWWHTCRSTMTKKRQNVNCTEFPLYFSANLHCIKRIVRLMIFSLYLEAYEGETSVSNIQAILLWSGFYQYNAMMLFLGQIIFTIFSCSVLIVVSIEKDSFTNSQSKRSQVFHLLTALT